MPVRPFVSRDELDRLSALDLKVYITILAEILKGNVVPTNTRLLNRTLFTRTRFKRIRAERLSKSLLALELMAMIRKTRDGLRYECPRARMLPSGARVVSFDESDEVLILKMSSKGQNVPTREAEMHVDGQSVPLMVSAPEPPRASGQNVPVILLPREVQPPHIVATFGSLPRQDDQTRESISEPIQDSGATPRISMSNPDGDGNGSADVVIPHSKRLREEIREELEGKPLARSLFESGMARRKLESVPVSLSMLKKSDLAFHGYKENVRKKRKRTQDCSRDIFSVFRSLYKQHTGNPFPAREADHQSFVGLCAHYDPRRIIRNVQDFFATEEAKQLDYSLRYFMSWFRRRNKEGT